MYDEPSLTTNTTTTTAAAAAAVAPILEEAIYTTTTKRTKSLEDSEEEKDDYIEPSPKIKKRNSCIPLHSFLEDSSEEDKDGNSNDNSFYNTSNDNLDDEFSDNDESISSLESEALCYDISYFERYSNYKGGIVSKSQKAFWVITKISECITRINFGTVGKKDGLSERKHNTAAEADVYIKYMIRLKKNKGYIEKDNQYYHSDKWNEQRPSQDSKMDDTYLCSDPKVGLDRFHKAHPEAKIYVGASTSASIRDRSHRYDARFDYKHPFLLMKDIHGKKETGKKNQKQYNTQNILWALLLMIKIRTRLVVLVIKPDASTSEY